MQEVIRLPGNEFNHPFALDAWGGAPRGGMLSIVVAIGLIEVISNRFSLFLSELLLDPAVVFPPFGPSVTVLTHAHDCDAKHYVPC